MPRIHRTEKRCPRCKLTKPAADYFSRTSNADGLAAYCKVCTKARRKELRDRAPVTPGAEDRFWSRVEKTDTCWLYTAGKNRWGYGMFYYGGKDTPAHHMPMIFRGEVPPKFPMVCDHLCKVRHCVRPEHIRVVTQSVNTRENNESPHAVNGRKTHCQHGHPLSGANLALYTNPGRPGRPNRVCLTCFPYYWRFAVIPRDPPPGARKRGRSEQSHQCTEPKP